MTIEDTTLEASRAGGSPARAPGRLALQAGLRIEHFVIVGELGNDGRVRVGDFGLVATSGAGEAACDAPADHAALSVTLTHTGALVGTPLYMAPEQHA